MEITQFFNIRMFSPKESKSQVSVDVTKYVADGLTLTDEDGLIKECTFEMRHAYLMMDILAIGMRTEIIGGDLTKKESLFSGYVKALEPNFRDDGEVSLRVSVYSDEGSKLGITMRDTVYPSSTNSFSWAKQEMMYSEIITNLAKEVGIRVDSSNIRVVRDIKSSLKGAVRQKNQTDWAFMQDLAGKIGCTLWTEERGGHTYLYLKDDRFIVNTVGDHTFFFLARQDENEFIPIQRDTTGKQIQILSAKVKLDTSSNKGSYKQKQTTDPKTGKPKTQIFTDKPVKNDKGEETGDTERWVLDEGKLRAMSFEERNDLIALFMSGKITWDGDNGGIAAKNYFRKEVISTSSRQGTPNHTEVENSGDTKKPDGINTENPTKENTGSSSSKTVIDEDKLRNLSSEQRSAIMGRIVRGTVTEADRQYYKTVDTTPKDSKSDANTSSGMKQNTQAGVDEKKPEGRKGNKAHEPRVETNSDKRKRDDGFTITATIYGNLHIKPRKSYIVEGLGKYSGKYYLYKITHTFGDSGHMMELIFTK